MRKKRLLENDIEQVSHKKLGARNWKSGKQMLYSAGVLAVLVGGGTVISSQLPLAIHVHADTLASRDSLLGKINDSIPVIKSSTKDTSSQAFQNTIDSITKNLPQQADYLITDTEWGANTTLTTSSTGKVVPLSSWQGDAGKGAYSLFTPSGTPTSLYADGFNGNDLSANLPLDGSGWLQISNVGTAKNLKTGQTITLDAQVTVKTAGLVSPGNNQGIIVSAHDKGGTISLGHTPIQTGATSSGGSNEGGTVSGNGSIVSGASLGWTDKIEYEITFRNHDTGEALPTNTLMATKVSDIDGYQNAQVGVNGLLGVVVAPDTKLSINNSGLSYNGSGTTVDDGKNLNDNAYVAIKYYNPMRVTFVDQTGLGDPNEGKHFDIVADLFGHMYFKLNLNASHKITKTQTKQESHQGSGPIAGVKFDETVYKSDGKTVDTSINGSYSILDGSGKDTGQKAVFTNGVAKNLTTPKDGTIYIKAAYPIGDVIKDTETSVPAPYTLGHTDASGKLVNDPISSTITSDDKGIATAAFTDNKQVGGIKIIKKGLYSDLTMLNSFYSLAGNKFTITDKDNNALQTLTTNDKGEGSSTSDPTASPLVIGGTYTATEIQSSNGFANTFETKSVTFTYKGPDQVIDWETVTGTNTEVTGDLKLQKEDADSDSTTTQGNATLAGTEQSFYYAKDITDATGKVIHKAGDIVKLSDGFKNHPITVTQGTVVTNDLAPEKDALTIRVDDKAQLAFKGLPEGDYKRVETQAPFGYTRDTKEYPFSIHKTNDQTKVIDLSDKTENQVIRFSLKWLKNLGHNGSLTPENGAEFGLTPADDSTKAINDKWGGANSTAKTGSGTDNDGFTKDGAAQFLNVPYGHYYMHQTVIPKGTTPIDDIEIIPSKVTTDGAPDKYLLTLKWKDSGQVISTHEIDAKQLVDGNVSLIKLDLGLLTDNELTPKPSIDIEKANDKMPKAGKGNDQDSDNNIGELDHDTAQTPALVEGNKTTVIDALVTNNGKDNLTEVAPKDKLLDSKVDLTKLTYTSKGQKLTLNHSGQLELDGKLFVLKVGETLEITGELPALPAGELHGDEFEVNAVGVTSHKPVHDHDRWYGKTPKPSIDIEKGNDKMPKAGKGNDQDKDNNIGDLDHDTEKTAAVIEGNKTTVIDAKVTNNGEDNLTKVAPKDKLLNGKVDLTQLTYTSNGQKLTLNKSGQLESDGKLFILKAGATLEITGELPALPVGELHGDEFDVDAEGVTSHKPVHDHDRWYGKTPKPSIDIEKANDKMPEAGKGNDQDKDNNIGSLDHDTEKTAAIVPAKKVTIINAKITNNGEDDLTKVAPKDKLLNGKVDLTKLTYTSNGQKLTFNKSGQLESDGKLFVLKVGATLEITGELPALPVGELHGDEFDVDAVGVTSHKPVHDHDRWYGKTPKPSIDIEKANGAVPKAGQGNDKDKENNIGANDHDTASTALDVESDAKTTIAGGITNNGEDSLSHIKFTDQLLKGSIKVEGLQWAYKGQKVSTNKDGEFTTADGKLLVLAPGETLTETTGKLKNLPVDEEHGDEFGVSAIGVTSGTPVGDHDKFFAKGIKPLTPAQKIFNLFIPDTGEKKGGLITMLGVLFAALGFLGFKALKKNKEKQVDEK